MYTRNHVCTLADIEVERFKSLARRNLLPTIYVPVGQRNENIQDEIRAPGWNRFSAFDAVQIAVMNALVRQMGYASGLSHDTAANIASCNKPAIQDALDRRYAAPSAADIWIGYVAYSDGGGANKSGDLLAITLKTSVELVDGAPVARVFLINVSEVIRDMTRRAEAADIQFPIFEVEGSEE